MLGEEKRKWVLASMDQEECAEVIANLVNGRETITYEELHSIAPHIDDDRDLLLELLDQLDHLGIAVLNPQIDPGVNSGNGNGSNPNGARREIPDLAMVPVEDLLDVYLTEVAQEPPADFPWGGWNRAPGGASAGAS